MGLHSTVYLDVAGAITGFGPDDDLPEAVARRIGAHAFVDGEHPYPETTAPTREAGTVPPKAGPGSSKDAWTAYAAEQGVEVPPEATTREAIIAVLVDAGKPVDPQ